MANTKRTACKYDDTEGSLWWVPEKQNKDKEVEVSGFPMVKKRRR